MSLVAYMDDSGTHAGAPNALVAGYWGGVKEWSALEWSWKKVLTDFGIDEFHAKRFWFRNRDGSRVSPYTGWDDSKHHDFIDKLLGIVESSKVVPFAYGVSTAAWDGRSDFWKSIFAGPGFGKGKQHDPLFLSFQVAISKTVLYCKPGKKMHFIYDLDGKNCGRFAEWYRGFKRDTNGDEERLGDLTFADSRQAVPLQAADLLAYEGQRYKRKSHGDPDTPIRAEYMRALRRFRSQDDFWLFDEPRLRNLEGILDAAVKESQDSEAHA